MKHLLRLTFFVLLVTAWTGAMAQSGELDRFSSSAMEELNKVKIYPNPTDDYLHVEIGNSSLKHPSLVLYNIIGNQVEVPVEKMKDNLYQIQVKNLPPGYYLVAIKDDETFFGETYKFIKK